MAAKHDYEEEIGEAVEELMETIDDHDLTQADVPQKVSYQFFRALSQECLSRAEAIKQEMGEEFEDDSDEDDGA